MSRSRLVVRYALALLVLAMFVAPSCGAGFDPPSKVNTLRVLGVTIDKPYALPGEEVTFRMTVADGLGNADGEPRDLQIAWIGGCSNPDSDLWFLCFEQLAEQFQSLAGGGLPPDGLVAVTLASGTSSGLPDAHEYSLTLPDDIVSSRPVPDLGPHYGLAIVFYAVCAGSLAPANLDSLAASSDGSQLTLPLECLDESGNRLGAESFVIGFTQAYAFADSRGNDNPPIDGMEFSAQPWSDDLTQVPIVPPCPVSEADRKQGGCATEGLDSCEGYVVKALVGDVAEVDPDAFTPEGVPFREVVWVNYFADSGDIEDFTKLVSDAELGYLGEHETLWYAPPEPALVTVWAVARDQRGGQTVVRRFIRVQE